MISQLSALLDLSYPSTFGWGSVVVNQAQFTPVDAPWCAGLGESTTGTLEDFRLYAWNTDRPNDNATGVPLVLATTGATATAYSHTLAVSLCDLTYSEMNADNPPRRPWNHMVITNRLSSRWNKVVSSLTREFGRSQRVLTPVIPHSSTRATNNRFTIPWIFFVLFLATTYRVITL